MNVGSYGWSGSTHGAVSCQIVLFDGIATLTEQGTRGWKGSMLHNGPIGFPGRVCGTDLDCRRRSVRDWKTWSNRGPTGDLAGRPQPIYERANFAENVVGEIVGAEHPEQVVITSGAPGSCDLSAGATDDGTGCSIRDRCSPRNSRRWCASRQNNTLCPLHRKEQGLLGSQAYVEHHRAELPNFVCTLVMDWGARPITRFPLAGHPEMEAHLKNLFQADEAFKSINTSSGS